MLEAAANEICAGRHIWNGVDSGFPPRPIDAAAFLAHEQMNDE
jgi:hypothetical protein